MTLTRFERLTLINQFKILNHLEESEDHNEQIAILENGYEVLYNDHVFHWLARSVSPEGGKFVLDVLTMYRYLDMYLGDHPEDAAIRTNVFVEFRGFDGNSDDGYRGLAQFLVTNDRFSEQQGRRSITDNFNSHADVVDHYRAMLVRFEEWRDRTRHSMAQLEPDDAMYIVTGKS